MNCKGLFYAVLFVLPAVFSGVKAQSCYWIGFTDKKNSTWSVSKPSQFLSERALQRRYRQGIVVDTTDLPVCKNYVDSVLKTGAGLIHTSRWLNGITVTVPADSVAARISRFGFVKEVQLTRPRDSLKHAGVKFENFRYESGSDTAYYGKAAGQINQLNGRYLHEKNFRGKGIQIAVLDAGFMKVDLLPAFDSLWHAGRILGSRDFVHRGEDIFRNHFHGMAVLSTMGGNMPGKLVGTAPEASFWLLRSEDAATEYLIEEDNWVAAAEFADSVGADIINTSLGYSTFNLASMNHTYADMNGHTTRVSKAANMASAKGMLVFVSAGNEGNKPWRYVMSPADADSAVAVGAVNKDSIRADFSSVGPSSDGEVKPNLAATGWGAAVQDTQGNISSMNGTSFSSPILAGMAACLWQAYPKATAAQIKYALFKSGNHYYKPDSLTGYGIPDMQTAGNYLGTSSYTGNLPANTWSVYPNPFTGSVSISSRDASIRKVITEIVSLSGYVVYRKTGSGSGRFTLDGLNFLRPGIYFLQISSSQGREVQRIIKAPDYR